MERNDAILYMECPVENKQDFKATKEISEDEYVQMLRDYSLTLGTADLPSRSNRYNVYDIQDFQEDEPKDTFAIPVKLYDISGQPCGVRGLYDIEDTGVQILIIEIVSDFDDDRLEEEFRIWTRESNRINSDTKLDDEQKILCLPAKDFEAEIGKHVFLFAGCKLYYQYNDKKMALIIKRIKEI